MFYPAFIIAIGCFAIAALFLLVCALAHKYQRKHYAEIDAAIKKLAESAREERDALQVKAINGKLNGK